MVCLEDSSPRDEVGSDDWTCNTMIPSWPEDILITLSLKAAETMKDLTQLLLYMNPY